MKLTIDEVKSRIFKPGDVVTYVSMYTVGCYL